jgi:small subunit ribosomal protein S6
MGSRESIANPAAKNHLRQPASICYAAPSIYVSNPTAAGAKYVSLETRPASVSHDSAGGVCPLRTYESLFIVQPNATDEEVQSVVQGVESIVTQEGGAILVKDIWGKRRLSYEVKKFNEGIYVLLRYQCPGALIKKLESHLKLNDEVIRYITVYFDEKTLRLEDEQKKRTAIALERAAAEGRRAREEGDDDDDQPRRGRRRREEEEEDTVEV